MLDCTSAMGVDLTLEWHPDMLSFPGYPAFRAEKLSDYESDGLVSHEFTATSHTGTHIDAPAHFIDGAPGIDEIDLDTLNGPAKVIDLRSYRGEQITAGVLDARAETVRPGDRLVLLTGDVDRLPPDESFFDAASALTVDAAEWLVERDIALLANDFLTEGLEDPDRPVHHTILGDGIPVIEYLCNADAIADRDEVALTCLPLLIAGFEAAPARVVADL